MKKIAPRLKKLGAVVHTIGECGNGNLHTLLIAQRCLADVIAGSSDWPGQLDKIQKTLLDWFTVLFDDPRTEEALAKITAKQ